MAEIAATMSERFVAFIVPSSAAITFATPLIVETISPDKVLSAACSVADKLSSASTIFPSETPIFSRIGSNWRVRLAATPAETLAALMTLETWSTRDDATTGALAFTAIAAAIETCR